MQFRRTSGRDSAQVVTPFVQVGTSPLSSVTRGADYAFTSAMLWRIDSGEYPRLPLGFIIPARRTISLRTSSCPMIPSSHPLTDLSEELEVSMLAGSHRIRNEMGDDSRNEKRKTSNFPLQRPITSVGSESPATEMPLDIQ